jgi:hypothetical protein
MSVDAIGDLCHIAKDVTLGLLAPISSAANVGDKLAMDDSVING